MTDFEHITFSGPDPGAITLEGREPGPQGRSYTLEILPGPLGLDPQASNADIILTFADGERRSATFMTIENVVRFMREKQSGPPHDAYIWAGNLVIVQSLKPEHVAQTVQAMIRRHELPLAFSAPPDL